ncbi:MAG TPA: hypothetical protein PKD37_04830 [Oligoflexia bacterium]|nr:hypothetical protein [Oligoflexia bacterium]HMP27290.1 hypothetical protein [Oligoflexia bacterium]
MLIRSLCLIFITLLLTSCGGSSSDSGILLKGKLTEGGGAHHSAMLKHAPGQPIEEVKICALGRCSTTDLQGLWGFFAPSDFNGGPALFLIDGHGIKAQTAVTVPTVNDGESVFIHFERRSDSDVIVHHIDIESSGSDHNHDHSADEHAANEDHYGE